MSTSKKISTIVNAAEILKCLSEGIGKISDISYRLSLNKATVHRTLKTLESTGLAYQDPITREYHLGPLIHRLASDPINGHQTLFFTAHKYLENLRDISGETVGLQVRIGAKRLVVDEAESHQNIKFSVGKGFSGPIYVGASGKVMLADLSEHDLHMLLNKIELVSHGPNTITDKAVLLKELKTIRQQGYATSYNELGKGAAVIAVPIKNYVVATALGIVGPGDRFSRKRMDLLEPLRKIACRISKDLKKTDGIK